MACSAPALSFRSLVPALLGLLCFAAVGCSVELVDEAVEASCAGTSCGEDPASAGDADAESCDDGDPCTADANCTPCSALSLEEREARSCTPDDELPALCAGRSGCVHAPMTTPAGQVDSCFPVAGDPELHAGVCRAGRCAENER